jgi:hypothetical protein
MQQRFFHDAMVTHLLAFYISLLQFNCFTITLSFCTRPRTAVIRMQRKFDDVSLRTYTAVVKLVISLCFVSFPVAFRFVSFLDLVFFPFRFVSFFTCHIWNMREVLVS